MDLNFILVYVCGIAALAVALFLMRSVSKVKVADKSMEEISGSIKEGAMAYLFRQYKVLAVFIVVMFAVLCFTPGLGVMGAVCFLAGALLSALSGFIGMRAAVTANVRTTSEARSGMQRALRVAFSGGAVMGLCVVSFGVIGVASLYLIFQNMSIVTGFGLGASSIALFCRVGGGIYTKAADVGADLVGKVEAGIPEDDPRNPGVIADNVGDNVGDVAGMGSDLFESYVGAIISALILGIAAFQSAGVTFTMLLLAAGLLTTIIGIVVVRAVKVKNPQTSFNIGTYAGVLIELCVTAGLSYWLFGNLKLFLSVGVGLLMGIVVGKLTEYYTADNYKPVQKIAEQSLTGPATNILSGYSLGLRSTTFVIILLAITILVSFHFGGAFGVALAAVGMLSNVGMTIAVDTYGPIADNAGGIAEMSGQPEEVREITDKLDSAGNTTAAIGKGFSICSAALTALALFMTYSQTVGLTAIDTIRPAVLAGVLLGGMLPFLFSALTIDAVGKSANKMIEEIRRQFREIPGIMEYKAKPDYRRCIDISTRAALRQMILPGVIAIAAPILVGVLLGAEALGGLLVGSLVTGVLMAISMANSGGAWDNTKKYIEASKGGKGSEQHKAAVIGDTVGDPFKDTAGPSLNILIKLMSIVAVVFAPLFL